MEYQQHIFKGHFVYVVLSIPLAVIPCLGIILGMHPANKRWQYIACHLSLFDADTKWSLHVQLSSPLWDSLPMPTCQADDNSYICSFYNQGDFHGEFSSGIPNNTVGKVTSLTCQCILYSWLPTNSHRSYHYIFSNAMDIHFATFYR